MQASIPPVQGVTCATLFVGMWRTCFSWHTEDYDLSALNMLHTTGCAALNMVHEYRRANAEDGLSSGRSALSHIPVQRCVICAPLTSRPFPQ